MASDWVETLVLVRHGESEGNVASRRARQHGHHVAWDGARQADIVLTSEGIRQAVATGKVLAKEFIFDRVFVSPYQRTIQTAEHVCAQFPYPAQLRYDERIREREMGMLDGLTDAGIAKSYPEEWKRMQRDGKYYYRAPGGESYPDVALRIHSFLTSMRQNFAGKRLLVVTHGNAIWAFRRLLERIDEPKLMRLQQEPSQQVKNCAVFTYVRGERRGRAVMTLRDCAVVAY